MSIALERAACRTLPRVSSGQRHASATNIKRQFNKSYTSFQQRPQSHTKSSPRPSFTASRRLASTTAPRKIDILESADKPSAAKEPEEGLESSKTAPLSTEEFHERSDAFFEDLLNKLEDLSEERGDIDVEYSAGVMNVTLPNKGTYVLNKQPPNKQIWLSSPESGPKRFDWVIQGASMEHKEGGESLGDWIYLRDGSSLAEILRVEVGVHLDSAGREI